MNRTSFYIFLIALCLLQTSQVCAQQKIFNRKFSLGSGLIRSITQDKHGYIWLGSTASQGGLYKYDGTKIQSFFNDPKNTNSLGNNFVRALATDSAGMIWIGTWGSGLNRFDPDRETFTHYRHNANDPASLSNDTILCIQFDHSGRLWVGTSGGLNLLDQNTGKFTRFTPGSETPENRDGYQVYQIYEDRQKNLWIATWGSGLDKFNPETEVFTGYKHRAGDRNSISSDTVTAVFEDSRGTLWVGTIHNRLQSLNRETGAFTHYPRYDPDYTNQLSGPPLYRNYSSVIRFIAEDAAGALWVGGSFGGINKYDPITNNTVHYGVYTKTTHPDAAIIPDSISGLNAMSEDGIYSFFQSRDGLFWISTSNYLGNVFNANPLKKPIPYHRLNTTAVNSFAKDKSGALWIGTQEGLIYKPVQGPGKKFTHNPNNPNSLSNDIVNSIRLDASGNLWIATYGGGINKLDPATKTFTHYRYDKTNTTGYDKTTLLYIDSDSSLWVTTDSCLNRINMRTGTNEIYRHDPADSNSLVNGNMFLVTGEKDNIWVGTEKGLNRLDKSTGKWRRFIPDYLITSLFIDTANVLWVGTSTGLLRHNSADDSFSYYTDPNSGITVRGNVMNVIADDQSNLWVSFAFRIFRINAARDNIRVYGNEYGVHNNQLLLADNFKAQDGKLFLGDDQGYYAFYPEELKADFTAPSFLISAFRMGNKDVKPGKGSPLTEEITTAKEIRLASNQNSFSLQFMTLNYNPEEKISYRYLLENYDSTWIDLGTQDKAYFFNVPPGDYTFRVRAVSNNGAWAEKTIAVTIKLPWWQTWWGILVQVAILIGVISLVSYLRSRQLRQHNKLLEEKVNQRTQELEKSYHNVEQLGEIGRKITSSLSVEKIISTAYKNVNSLMDANVFGIGIYNETLKRIEFPATYEEGKSLPFYSNAIDDKNRLSSICLTSGKEIVIGNLHEEYSHFLQKMPTPHEGEQPLSLIFIPLVAKEKKLGVITVQSFHENAYSDNHLYMLRNIAVYATIALENAEAYEALSQTVTSLKQTQTQLIQSEKMASLGELTAGIAHEIQNPLNFINNFSEVNMELMDEMKMELEKGNSREVVNIAGDVSLNLGKILHHGKRAGNIVKGMLQHSRNGSGQKEFTDINALADEYLRLAYHGLRAKDKTFNASTQTDYDPGVGRVELVPQDIGRVILNLITNAFYAVAEKKKSTVSEAAEKKYEPTVSLSTKREKGKIVIKVKDNGNGIPEKILDKIFQPFFTTKPTGQGTGLGLSLSYDIITHGHGGELKLDTKEGEGTTFTILIPANS